MFALATVIIAAWVQYAADGAPHARVIAEKSCPSAIIDGVSHPMEQRAAATLDFENVVCDVAIPVKAKKVSVEGRALPLLHGPPRKIAVIGDTGCRIKGLITQPCADPDGWPFPTIAKQVAREKPDLIIHVGDYFYRETPCPPLVSACANSPHGDSWAAWDADWFAPAAPLFATAPMILVRGNHEDCLRGRKGWTRYLSPLSTTDCLGDEGPFAIELGNLKIVVFDSSAADDVRADPYDVSHYKQAFDAAANLARGETWLLSHKPIYGALEEAGVFTFTNATLQSASDNGKLLTPYEALLSGHLHTFEAISPENAPPQIVNGMSGDKLDNRVKAGIEGKIVLNRKVKSAFADARFGYGIYQKMAPHSWEISVKDPSGIETVLCSLRNSLVECRGLP